MFGGLFVGKQKGNPCKIYFFEKMLSLKHNKLTIRIKNKRFFFLFNLFLFNLCFIQAQNHNTFVQDSLLERKYFNEGMNEAKKGDFEKAEDYFQTSLKLAIKLYSADDRIIKSYNNVGIQQKNLGKYDEALKSYFNAEKLIKSVYGENDSRLGMVYGNAGIVYKLKGDHAKALEYQESTLRIFSSDVNTFTVQDRIKIAEFNLAVSLVKLNRVPEAINIIQKNIKGETTGITPRFIDLLANIYLDKNDIEYANKYYLKSIDSWIDFFSTGYYGLGEEYASYANFLIKTGDYSSAQIYNQKAESIIQKTYGIKGIYYSDIQNNYGDILLNQDSKAVSINDFRKKKKDNINKALAYYQKAAIAVVENYKVEDPYSLPPIENAYSDLQLLNVLKKKATAFQLLAEICKEETNYDNYLRFNIQALNTINSCTNLIHRLRIGYMNEESKLMLAEKQESTFMDAISITYQLYQFTKEKQYLLMAFEFTEKSKSASFLASVKDMEAKEFGGIPDSLLKREQYLKINISNYKELLFQENQQENPDSQKTNLYAAKIFQHNEEYNQLISLFEQKYPRYYSFKYENKVITIDEIQRNLRKKDAVVEYVINEPTDATHPGQLYRFTITRDKVDMSLENIDYAWLSQIESTYNFFPIRLSCIPRKETSSIIALLQTSCTIPSWPR